MIPEDLKRLAEAVRVACIEAAKKGYEDAAESGLCHQGAVEASLDAIRMVDLKRVLSSLPAGKKPL